MIYKIRLLTILTETYLFKNRQINRVVSYRTVVIRELLMEMLMNATEFNLNHFHKSFVLGIFKIINLNKYLAESKEDSLEMICYLMLVIHLQH